MVFPFYCFKLLKTSLRLPLSGAPPMAKLGLPPPLPPSWVAISRRVLPELKPFLTTASSAMTSSEVLPSAAMPRTTTPFSRPLMSWAPSDFSSPALGKLTFLRSSLHRLFQRICPKVQCQDWLLVFGKRL